MQNLQKKVFEAIQARGYTQGLAPAVLAARQVVKCAEELAELARFFNLPERMRAERWAAGKAIAETGRVCRRAFDDGCWIACGLRETTRIDNQSQIAAEIADVVITMLTLAEALDIDLEAVILEKAHRDITRGVRG